MQSTQAEGGRHSEELLQGVGRRQGMSAALSYAHTSDVIVRLISCCLHFWHHSTASTALPPLTCLMIRSQGKACYDAAATPNSENTSAQGSYTDKGYVSKEPSTLSEGVPGLPFLVGVVLALFGALGYVVSQTS